MRTKRAWVSLFPLLSIVALLIPVPSAFAQSTSSVGFSITPALFPAGQAVSAFVCITSTGATVPATLQTGDRFMFSIGASIGAVTSLGTPLYVNSSTLAAADFSAAFGSSNNQVVVTYNGTAKTFAYGDSIYAKVNFTASSQIGSATVFNTDIETYAIEQASFIETGGSPSSIQQGGGLAFDGHNIWVGITVNDNPDNINLLLKVRPNDGSVLGYANLGGGGFTNVAGLAFDGINVWVARSDSLVKVRASDMSVQGTFNTPGAAKGVAFGAGNVWVACNSSGLVAKIFAGSTTNSVASFMVGSGNSSAPLAIAFDGANMWVPAVSDNVVVKMGPDGSVLGTYSVGARPNAVVFDGANIWVASSGSNTVTKLRASDGSIVGTFNVALSPVSLIFDGANIWVASTNNTLTKL
jgi:hypothetical protein